MLKIIVVLILGKLILFKNYVIGILLVLFDLLILSCNYSIQWKECSCLKGIRLEDVTAELEEEAYEEMKNNK